MATGSGRRAPSHHRPGVGAQDRRRDQGLTGATGRAGRATCVPSPEATARLSGGSAMSSPSAAPSVPSGPLSAAGAPPGELLDVLTAFLAPYRDAASVSEPPPAVASR